MGRCISTPDPPGAAARATVALRPGEQQGEVAGSGWVAPTFPGFVQHDERLTSSRRCRESYRDLLQTAERIIDMDVAAQTVESHLGEASLNCNSRLLDRKAKNLKAFNDAIDKRGISALYPGRCRRRRRWLTVVCVDRRREVHLRRPARRPPGLSFGHLAAATQRSRSAVPPRSQSLCDLPTPVEVALREGSFLPHCVLSCVL